jgi:cytidine deaminase
VSNRSLLESDDEQLLNAARELIRRRFKEGRHYVAASLRDRQGKVFSAVHLKATVGRVAICAEAIALGEALVDGDAVIDAIVAQRQRHAIRVGRLRSVVCPLTHTRPPLDRRSQP